MSRLKCLNCGSTFGKEALLEHGSVGITRAGVSVGYGLIIWPFVLRVYAKCPVC